MKLFALFFVLALMIVSCAPSTPVQPTSAPVPPTATAIPFILSSAAFSEGQPIPVDYSCKGANISPALTWTEPPTGTQSFVIIMDDPQAQWVHWALYNIPASTRELKENMPTDANLSDGSMQARTSFGKSGYGGPCPPSKHTYVFTLYALDSVLSVPATGYKSDVLKAMESHILESTELTGTFAP